MVVLMAGYDIHYQPVPAEQVSGLKCYEFGFKSALKVSGMQALVNRWGRIFMTPKGSDLLEPTSGTGMASLIEYNITSLTTEVIDAVALAISETNDQVKEQDITGFYSEQERLQNAYLVTFTQVQSGFEVWIHIDNAAGQSLEAPLATLETR